MYLPPSVALDVLAIWTGGDRMVSLHTDAPGADGGHEAGAVDRASITSATWGASAEAAGELCGVALTSGRQRATGVVVAFPGATSAVTVSHVGLWNGDTWLGGEALEDPVALATGDEAYIDVGGLLVMVFGTSQVN